MHGARLYDLEQVPGPLLASISLSGQREGGVLWYESIALEPYLLSIPSPRWEGGTELGLHLGLQRPPQRGSSTQGAQEAVSDENKALGEQSPPLSLSSHIPEVNNLPLGQNPVCVGAGRNWGGKHA